MDFKELKNMDKKNREKKLKELKMELAKAYASKTVGKIKRIKKMIAEIYTLNTSENGGIEK